MMMKYIIALALMPLLLLSVNADDISVSKNTDAIINLPLTGTWNLFTTNKGLMDMGYENVSMQLKLDEHVHAERKTGAQQEVIDGTLSSFDPQHMISWRWSSDHTCWSVLYFNDMGKEMTQIRWVDMCNDESVDLDATALMHRDLFNQLIRRYAPECHVCKEEREAAEKAEKH